MKKRVGDDNSGFENGSLFVVYTDDAHALRELSAQNGNAMKIVGNAFCWFVGLPYERFKEHSMQDYLFKQIQRGCRYNATKHSAGIKGGVKSGEVRKHRAECRQIPFKDKEDILAAMNCGDGEIYVQAVMEYCGRRGDRKFENALLKRLKMLGENRFANLCEVVMTKEQEPDNRSNAVIGALDVSTEKAKGQR